MNEFLNKHPALKGPVQVLGTVAAAAVFGGGAILFNHATNGGASAKPAYCAVEIPKSGDMPNGEPYSLSNVETAVQTYEYPSDAGDIFAEFSIGEQFQALNSSNLNSPETWSPGKWVVMGAACVDLVNAQVAYGYPQSGPAMGPGSSFNGQ